MRDTFIILALIVAIALNLAAVVIEIHTRRLRTVSVPDTTLTYTVSRTVNRDPEYAKGVNDALDCFALLILEREVKRSIGLEHADLDAAKTDLTPMTYGDLNKIVCSRLGVERVSPPK
jgi:hypothetical protein